MSRSETGKGDARRLDAIESWFASHPDTDFQFARPYSYRLEVGDIATAETLVYTTKPHCVQRMHHLNRFEGSLAILGQYGLPIGFEGLAALGKPQRRLFVGDADPVDLLIFAWLREHNPFEWYGVNDAFLMDNGDPDLDRKTIPLQQAERDAIETLPDVCPDYRLLLGDRCASALDSGHKIEVEGALIERSR